MRKDILCLVRNWLSKLILSSLFAFILVGLCYSARPNITAFYINNNAVWVGNYRYIRYTNVTLHLSASNANEMRFENEGGSWSNWESYSESKSWTLTWGDGTKKVYTEVRNNDGTDDYWTEIILDQTAPSTSRSLSGTLGENGWYKSNVTVTLSAYDSGSGVDKTYYAIDYGAYQQYSSAFSLNSEGQHTVYYYSTDKAGNIETTRTVSIKIDKTAPSASMNAEPTYTQGTTNEVSGTAFDATSGIWQYFFQYDDASDFPSPNGDSGWTTSNSCNQKVMVSDLKFSNLFNRFVLCQGNRG